MKPINAMPVSQCFHSIEKPHMYNFFEEIPEENFSLTYSNMNNPSVATKI
jgi:hypothetical protein